MIHAIDTTDSVLQAYEDGYQAGFNADRAVNPYDPTTIEHGAWDDGFGDNPRVFAVLHGRETKL